MSIVYIHRKLDNDEIFYIGISKNTRRAFETFANAGNRRNIVWKRISDKHGVKVEITHQDICWEEACSIEKYLIEFWRGQGLFLANLTDGGEGLNGYKCTEEQRIRRISHLNTPEVREKQKKSMSRPDVLKKQSEIQKKVYSNPELRERQSEIQKKMHGTPEKRLEHKIISTNVFLREGYRENMKQKLKLAMNRPDVLKKFNRRVYQYDLNGNLLKEWDSIKSIENELGFCKTYIINCCKNRKENYKNYKWQYVCERYS